MTMNATQNTSKVIPDEVVKRLRREMEDHQAAMQEEGFAVGWVWAANSTYGELKRLNDWEERRVTEDEFACIDDVVEDWDEQNAIDEYEGDDPDFIRGFIRGALELFSQFNDKC
jgi:hypothetical protein